MGRNSDMNGIPNYRDVLVANAVRALRERMPAQPAFPALAARRTWLAGAADEGSWRAAAIAAAAVPDHALFR